MHPAVLDSFLLVPSVHEDEIISVYGGLDLARLVGDQPVDGHAHPQEDVLDDDEEHGPLQLRGGGPEGLDVGVHGEEGAVGHHGDDGGDGEGGVPRADVADAAGCRLAGEPSRSRVNIV